MAHKKKCKPHRRKKTRRGSSGMAGYSAGASEGKGLSDIAQRTWNAVKRASLSTGYEKYQFDVETMLIPGTNTLRGMYQLPESPQYAGGSGSFERPGERQQILNIQRYTQGIKRADKQAKGKANQFGGITTGYKRRYPSWVMGMLKGSELGKPPGSSSNAKLPVGLALIALKVLI